MSSFDPSTSKSKRTFYYDVFLTFRETEQFSATFLVKSLRDAGIKTFVPDDFTGRHSTETEEKALEGSRAVIVIFTPKLPNSIECLRRVVKVMWCHRTMSKPVLPVFCGVSPQQVLEKVETRDEDMEWSPAVYRATSLPGCTLSDSFSDREAISNIIRKLDEYLFLDLPYHLVGLQIRVNEVLRLLNWGHIGAEDAIFRTRIIGICGVGGIGKTSLARAIYDRIGGNFESKSFLANVTHVWEKDNGLVLLQKQLISDVLGKEVDEITDVEVTLGHRRSLVVLDDVSKIDQLMALCRSSEWFGKGSLIFITTKNKEILDHFRADLFEMKKLDHIESLQLFSWHAFKQFSPTNEFKDLSMKAITFCEGLPLALEVIGSLLYNRALPEWNNILNKLKGIPRGQIQEVLKISFDFLTDLEIDLFFNIACLYVGQSKAYVTQLLTSPRFHVDMGMRIIIERSLVKVINDKLYVHDLLQDIGRGINLDKPKSKYIYDVFLSFRGEDTRKSFTAHLCMALKQAGIEVFMDDKELERGENISFSLLQAIESSRISIIIFSKNYASSSWCLQELEKIMECHKTANQEVLPIFYDVQPNEVRKQENDFGDAWKRLKMTTSASEVKELITRSRRVLIEVANLSGWDMHNYRSEAELIDDVIETVVMKLDENKYLFVAHHPVGLKTRVQDIIQFLSNKSDEVIIAGILGIGGMGKTTIAKAIYNEIGQNFEGKSFIANIREVWKQNNGQIFLQEQLLSCILKRRRITLPSVEMGKTHIKDALHQKRTLVVLDDVNNEDQLKALCGSREWFGQGSRIIITTRDKHILQLLQVVNVYNMKELDNSESLELFSWHAFKQAHPTSQFVELSQRVISYCGGLPLALEILGSYLFDRKILEWESVLEKLQQIPNNQVHEKLKISYDGLSDHTEKDIFLDICCFLIGKERNFATQVLNGCRLHAEIGITRLIERGLVKVDNKNKLNMHDLLRDMGREIIRQQSPEEPEKRTRLWFHDDVLDVLRNNIGTIAVKGLALNMSRNCSLSLNTKAFMMMKRLRLLQLDHVQLVGDYIYLTKELRWLCWNGFPLENLPMNLSLEKVVAIDLKYSNLKKVWKKGQLLKQLKALNLSHSHYLRETPDFSKLPNLEKLILKDCPCLSMVHPTIGDLKHIVLINLKDCKDLIDLPRSIYNLKSLKCLNIFGCSKIDKLEEDVGKMESLTTLMANQTAITQVPVSLVRSKSIKFLSLSGYEGVSHDVFPSIVLSWMSPTNIPKSLLRSCLSMPYLIKGLSPHLLAISKKIFKARSSTSQSSCTKTPMLNYFHEQDHMERSEILMSSLTIRIEGSNKMMDILLNNISQGWNNIGLGGNSRPKDSSPDWLDFTCEGSSVLFKVPQIIDRSLKGFFVCIGYLSPQDSMPSSYPVGVMISNHTKSSIDFYKQDAVTTSNDEDCRNIISNLEPGNEVEVIVTLACELVNVKKIVVYLVYGENVDK